MSSWYVNTNKQSNGDNEVHVNTCPFWRDHMTYLGEYSSCGPAVQRAKQTYVRANGCKTCANACHTS